MQSVKQEEITMRDYVNQRPSRRKKLNWKTNKSEKEVYHLTFFCFGLLCIIQAILNLSLRLTKLRGCVSSQRCPLGWRQINSKCYFLSTESKRWNDGRKQCQSQGADLVVIDNEQEQNAIYRMDGSQYLFFWIGLRRKDGAFKWVDGSELKTTFWQNGQPDNGGLNSKEDCVEMGDENQPLASWNDVPCEQMRRWLCEKDLCFSL
ncbi:asialoglycoprotein receptor 1-like isoform X2 [Kryptolebias marmoratus]|uniref:asialoglycoprotein receptor 1-like isoform X2 n=1 Tax=Kryptolebias marmoratus TaxID=37003 RepID=UPI0018ACEA01|nr:asialoglycoprotein receptor 1-like isoform X2 [Kryptolebias marmoratus]